MIDVAEIIRPTADEIAAWNEQFRDATPQDLLGWGAERWDDRMALTCSFGGAAGMVLLDMVASIAPRTPVLYIDTGLLFAETYQLIDQIQHRYQLDLRMTAPARTVAEQALDEGDRLWERDPNRCCQLRKVEPLAEALAPFDAWITGIRREGTTTRANATMLQWSTKYDLVKLNPLVHWSERDVWRYISKHNVPYNPLLDQDYRSIGCWTCTRIPTSDDPRSGRWVGFNKMECGLHVEPA